MTEVSAAKRDITPEFPMYMRGYAMRTGKSIGVLDKLYARILALRAGGEVFIWATLDLCRLEPEITDYMRRVVGAKYSVPEEHIVIGTIHTHSGPDISFEDEGAERNARKARYRQWMMEQVFDGIDECFEKGFVEARPYAVCGKIKGLYGNRNYKDRPGDKEVNLILFRTPNHVAAGIFQMACHPTVLGIHNMKISSDLLGGLGKALDEKYHTIFITLQGACGDMGNRQYRQGNDEKELRRVQDGIWEQLESMADREMPVEMEPAAVKAVEYRAFCRYEAEALKRRIEEEEKKLEAASGEDERKLLWSGIRRLRQKLEEGGRQVCLKTILMKLGQVQVATIPGELFSAFGLRMKEAMEGPVRLVWGYANYSAGYLVEKEEFGKGYESMSTPLEPGQAEEYVETIIRELQGEPFI